MSALARATSPAACRPPAGRSLQFFAVAAVLLSGVAAPRARADADPPSDILVFQDVYFPYQHPVSRPVQRSLNAFARSLARRGGQLKIAIVATRFDLGAVAALFGQPARYARFLGQELTVANQQRPRLIVVMPAGAAAFGVARAAAAAVAQVAVPSGASSDALADVALRAARAVTAAQGAGGPSSAPAPGSTRTRPTNQPVPARPVPRSPVPSQRNSPGGGGSGVPVWLVVVAGFVLGGTAIAATARRRRRAVRGPGAEGRT